MAIQDVVYERRRMAPSRFLYAGAWRPPAEAGLPGDAFMVQRGNRIIRGRPAEAEGGANGQSEWADQGRFSRGTAPDQFEMRATPAMARPVKDWTRALAPGEWEAMGDGGMGRKPADMYSGMAAMQRKIMALPGAGGGGGGADLNGDGFPDGAEVSRTVTATGPDGQETKTVAKWIHRGSTSNQQTYQGDPMRFSPEQRAAITARNDPALNWGSQQNRERLRMMPANMEQQRELARLQFEAPAQAAAGGEIGAAEATGKWSVPAAEAHGKWAAEGMRNQGLAAEQERGRAPVMGDRGVARVDQQGNLTVQPWPEQTKVAPGVVLRPGEAPQWQPDYTVAAEQEKTRRAQLEAAEREKAIAQSHGKEPVVRDASGAVGIWRYIPSLKRFDYVWQKPGTQGLDALVQVITGKAATDPGSLPLYDPNSETGAAPAAAAPAPGTGASEELPVLTLEQARNAKPGTRYIGTDGVKRTRN